MKLETAEPGGSMKQGTVRTWTLLLSWAVLGFACTPGLQAQQTPAAVPVDAQSIDHAVFLKTARQAYYSLGVEGFAGAECDIMPDWERLLADERSSNPSGYQNALAKLGTIHFDLTVDSAGVAKVAHNEVGSENPQVSQALSQVYGGMEQLVSGFFQTWSTFVIYPALPLSGMNYKLQDVGTEYHLSYKDGPDASVATTLAKNFLITNMLVSTNEFVSTIRPQFRAVDKGFLLSGYDASYIGTSGENKTELDVAIDYQQVNDLQFPQKVALKGSYQNSPFDIGITFANCRANRR
jgi:hypothetical protein